MGPCAQSEFFHGLFKEIAGWSVHRAVFADMPAANCSCRTLYHITVEIPKEISCDEYPAEIKTIEDLLDRNPINLDKAFNCFYLNQLRRPHEKRIFQVILNRGCLNWLGASGWQTLERYHFVRKIGRTHT